MVKYIITKKGDITMICPKCSHENLSGASFCAMCGEALTVQESPIEQAPVEQVPELTLHEESTKPSFLSFVKGFVSSPIFLALCLVATALVLFDFVRALDLGAFFDETLRKDIISEFSDIYSERIELGLAMSVASAVVSSIVGMIPQILLLVGFWIMYGSSKKANTDTVSGIGLVKSYIIINEVVFYVGTALVLIGLAFLIAVFVWLEDTSYIYELPFYLLEELDINISLSDIEFVLEIIVALLAVIAAFVIAFLVLAIIYFVKLRRVLNDTKKCISKNVGTVRVSGFVIALEYFFAVCTLLGAVSAVFTSGIVGFLSSLSSGVFHLLVGIALSNYKKEIEKYNA